MLTLPDNLHEQVLKIADSLSYTTTSLVEIGLMVMNSKTENKDEKKASDIEEYCQKLIIQINGHYTKLWRIQAGGFLPEYSYEPSDE